MKELIDIIEQNNIKYSKSNFAGYESIIIRKNKYQLEIYETSNGFVSDLQEIPYNWGRMGTTTLEGIFEDLKYYLGITLTYKQFSIFDY